MKGIRPRKGKAQAKCRASQGKPKPTSVRCGIEDLVQYDAWYLGFRDADTDWTGTVCFRLAASQGAHAAFFAGRNASELRGRIGVVLEALDLVSTDNASECFVAFATRVGKRPKKLKAMLRHCPCQALLYLVFLLPEEQAPGVDWKRRK